MAKYSKAKRDIAQEVTDKLVAALESGVNPWRRPWRSLGVAGRGSVMPHNASTGKAYRGVNVMLCGLAQQAAGYTSAGWLTFKQARDLGGNVRKGEKGTLVVFWKFLERRTEGTDGTETKSRFPMLRHYTVFNVEQCDGLPERITNPTGAEPEAVPDLAAWVAETLSCRVDHGGERACYIPSVDTIKLPLRSAFETEAGYSGTLLHEATHATGVKHRLDRLTMARFGSEDYAKEELVAEVGASMLCAHLGLDYVVEHHASYLESWLKALKGDKRYIFSAASAAQKAVDYVLGAAAEEEPEEVAEAA
ncbi:MAG TPA: zincin-like metallopeptidase domain-containing protein [Gammaproteobacteria bacterium]|nr:zincin-like metallopeptidase domain-containing protein [Gammaproteobacteria bacterium]